MVVRRPGTDEKKKGGTGEGGQTKAPGNIYYKTLVTYLDIDRSGCNGECFERNPLVRSISLISFFFFFSLSPSLSSHSISISDSNPFQPSSMPIPFIRF